MLGLQTPQRGLRGVLRGVGIDVDIVVHQSAQLLGALRDIGRGDDGNFSIHPVCQPDRTENVIHRKLNFNDWDREVLPQHGGRTAAGNHGVIIAVEIAFCNFQALFPVANKER